MPPRPIRISLLWRGFLTIICALLLWVALAVLGLHVFDVAYYGFHLPTIQDRGYFGEWFGFVNSIVSTLGFAALVFTLWVQNSQYRDQVERDLVASRVHESLNLFRYWSSSDFSASRTLVHMHLVATDGTIFLNRLSRGRQPDREIYEAIMNVIAFFVQWSALALNGAADAALLRNLLGDDAKAWDTSLFKRLDNSVRNAGLDRVRAGFATHLFVAENSISEA